MPDSTDRSHMSAGGPQASQERLVAGRYRLVRELGHGGMGVVWLAEDTELGRELAVKELRPPAGLPEADCELYRRRAEQEARSAARIRHPNAVTLYDVLSDAVDGAVYLIMEFIEGPTLAELIARDGALPAPRVAEFGRQLLDVLAAAHALGIVHRGVKPGNIMIAPGDQVKLTDFGIAYVVGDTRLTRSGVVGTHAYVAPELFESDPITPSVDLWSLGATLYYAADGHGPFDRGTTGGTLRAILLDGLPVPHCDERLAAAITSLLQRNPAERATVDQARALLGQVPGELATPAGITKSFQTVTWPAPPSGFGESQGWEPDAETRPREDEPTPVSPQDSPLRDLTRIRAVIAAVAAAAAVAAIIGGVLAAQPHGGSANVDAKGTIAPSPTVPIASLFSEDPAGQAVVFATSSGQIRYDSYTSGWHGPDVLPGTLRRGSPLVLSPDERRVFFFEPNGDVVNDYLSGSSWQGPYPVGGAAEAGSGLALAQSDGASNQSAVVFVNTSGRLVYDHYATAWDGPDALPGTPQDGSPLVDTGGNIFFLSHGYVVNDYYAHGAGWQASAPVGGAAEADSGLAIFTGDGDIPPATAFVSAKGKLVYDSYSAASSSWHGPSLLPGSPRAGSPIVWSGDGTSVYFIESDGRVATDYRSRSGWEGPKLTGGSAVRGSALNYAPGTGTAASRPNLTFIDTDGALVYDWYANGWHGPAPLPGA